MARKYLGGSGEGLTVWISLAASTVLIFYGYDQGVFGNVLVKDDFLRTVGHPSVTAQGTMTSVYNLGCFAGALSTLYTGDKLGRPRTLILGSSVIALGAIIQAACYNAAMLYVGRVVAGLGTGMNTATGELGYNSLMISLMSRSRCLAIRNIQDAQSREAHHYTDGKLYHWLRYLKLANPRFQLRSRKRLVAIPASISDLLLRPDLADVPIPPRQSTSTDPKGQDR